MAKSITDTLIELIARLNFLRFAVGHAQLRHAADWLALIDTGAVDA